MNHTVLEKKLDTFEKEVRSLLESLDLIGHPDLFVKLSREKLKMTLVLFEKNSLKEISDSLKK